MDAWSLICVVGGGMRSGSGDNRGEGFGGIMGVRVDGGVGFGVGVCVTHVWVCRS